MESSPVSTHEEHQLWKDHAPSKDYFGSLDTLRFLAFFLVFANHVAAFLHFPASVGTMGTPAFTYLQMGDLGVAFFFVLSGFLITYLLEKERVKTGTVSLKNFYIRRVLRIWPLYFLVLGIIITISFLFHGFDLYKTMIDWKEVLYHIFFAGNIFRSFQGTSNEMIAIFWSIAVEEQFYLVWPAIFKFFRKYIVYVLAVGIVISMAVRYHYANNFWAREFFTPSVMVYLMVGALIGMYGPRLKHWLGQKKRALAVGFGSFASVVGLLSIRGFVFPYSYPQWFIALDGPLFAVFFALIILSAVYGGFGRRESYAHGHTWARVRSSIGRGTEYLGRISYGLYVYHLVALTIVLYIATKFGFTGQHIGEGTFFLLAGCAMALVISMSALSYRFWEGPFLKLKDRFIPRS